MIVTFIHSKTAYLQDRDVYFIIPVYKMLLFISNIKHSGSIVVDVIGWWLLFYHDEIFPMKRE